MTKGCRETRQHIHGHTLHTQISASTFMSARNLLERHHAHVHDSGWRGMRGINNETE